MPTGLGEEVLLDLLIGLCSGWTRSWSLSRSAMVV